MATVSIGAMRHRLVLQAPVEIADLAGGVARSWSTLASIWAAIEPVSTSPAIVGDAPSGLVTHRITIRWRADVVAGQRLTKAARTFMVRTVTDPDERRLRLVLAAEEMTA